MASPGESSLVDSIQDFSTDSCAFVSGLDSESWEAYSVFNRPENLSACNQMNSMGPTIDQTFTVQYYRDSTTGRLVSTLSPTKAAQVAVQAATQNRSSVSADQEPAFASS